MFASLRTLNPVQPLQNLSLSKTPKWNIKRFLRFTCWYPRWRALNVSFRMIGTGLILCKIPLEFNLWLPPRYVVIQLALVTCTQISALNVFNEFGQNRFITLFDTKAFQYFYDCKWNSLDKYLAFQWKARIIFNVSTLLS